MVILPIYVGKLKITQDDEGENDKIFQALGHSNAFNWLSLHTPAYAPHFNLNTMDETIPLRHETEKAVSYLLRNELSLP